jgi:hypothetical protein
MKEEPRPDSRSSVTSAESDLSVHDRHAAENKNNSSISNHNNNNNNNSIKSSRSSQSSASATVPGVKSKLSFGISRLLDEPKKSEETGEDSTDEEEEDEMHEGSSSPVTRSGSSHESSHHLQHPLHPESHNHHPHMPHAGAGPMYSYSPAFPWFGSYVGKEGIPRESPVFFSVFLPLLSLIQFKRRELNPRKASLLIDFLWLLK